MRMNEWMKATLCIFPKYERWEKFFMLGLFELTNITRELCCIELISPCIHGLLFLMCAFSSDGRPWNLLPPNQQFEWHLLPIYHLQSIIEIIVYFQINNKYHIDFIKRTSDFHLVTTQHDRNIVFAQILKYFYDNEFARRQKIWLMRL